MPRPSARGARPLVSVGLPVYNGEAYLAEAIESILAQTLDDLELVICNNASTDATDAICREFEIRDPRVRYTCNPRNLGAAANYNAVFRRARGRVFKWAAHDDLLEPGFLEACAERLLDEPPDVIVAFPRTRFISGDGRTIEQLDENPAIRFDEDLELPMERPHLRLSHFLLNKALCHPVFGLIRADALRRTGLIGAFPSSDVVVLGELAMQGKFVELPEPLFVRRLHPGTSMWNKTPAQIAAWFDTSRNGAFVMRQNRLFFEQARSVWRAPLAASERARCLRVLFRDQLPGRRKPILREWWQGVRHFAGFG